MIELQHRAVKTSMFSQTKLTSLLQWVLTSSSGIRRPSGSGAAPGASNSSTRVALLRTKAMSAGIIGILSLIAGSCGRVASRFHLVLLFGGLAATRSWLDCLPSTLARVFCKVDIVLHCSLIRIQCRVQHSVRSLMSLRNRRRRNGQECQRNQIPRVVVIPNACENPSLE